MADPDLRAIWRQQGEELRLPAVSGAIQTKREQSLDLVARIERTARREHRIFLILSAIGLSGMLLFGHYYLAVALFVFALLMIWKYEVEMRLLRKIRPEDSTLAYLRAISRLLQRFMRNYRLGIHIFIPLVVIGGIVFGQWLAMGAVSWAFWERPLIWGVLVVGVGLGILFARWWLKWWVNTFYGKKLRAMENMIRELEEN